MKITKEHVGKRVKGSDWIGEVPVRVTAVGETLFIGTTESSDREDPYYTEGDWELLPDPKPQGAGAFVRYTEQKRWWVSDTLYQSQEEAEAGYTGCQVVWPARIDPNTGMYILPED